MPVPADKNELLKAIDLNFNRLMDELHAVPLVLVNECSMEGHVKGTQMCVANLVAYLLGWNELVLKWLVLDKAGQSINFPETGFKWNQLGLLAQKFYSDYKELSYASLLERLQLVKQSIVVEIQALSNNTLYEHAWYGKWTMGRMVQFNTSSPYANARGRLRKWFKTRTCD